MLCLSRKRFQRILIDRDIRLTVLDIDRGKVRIGVEAPRGMPVWREECVPEGFETIWGVVQPADGVMPEAESRIDETFDRR